MDSDETREMTDDQVGRIVCALLTHAEIAGHLTSDVVMKRYLAFREAMKNEDDG